MYCFNLCLSPQMKRFDCKFYSPQEKSIHIKNCDRYLFEPLGNYVLVNGGKRLEEGAIIDAQGIIYKIPYVRAEDLNDGVIDFNSVAKISEEDHEKIKNYKLLKNDVCVSNVGTIGSIGFVMEEVNCNFSENMARLRIKDTNKLMPEYLFYYLLSDYAKAQFNRYFVGSLQYKLSLDSIKNECKIIIPLKNGEIDILKQKEIVKAINTIIKEQFEIQKLLKNEIKIYNNYIESELKISDCKKMKKMLFKINDLDKESRIDALFNNPGYRELKKYLSEIETIKLKNCLIPNTKKEKDIKSFYNIVDLENIDENLGIIKDFKQDSLLGSDKIKLNKNNILIPKMQTDKCKVAIVGEDYDNMCGSSEILQYIVKEGFDKNYILSAIRTSIVKEQWEYSITGSSRMRINDNIILNTYIPYPKNSSKREAISNELVSKLKKILDIKKRLKDINLIVTETFSNAFGIQNYK